MCTKFLIVSLVLVGLYHGGMSHNLQGPQDYGQESPNHYSGHVQGSSPYNTGNNNGLNPYLTNYQNGFRAPADTQAMRYATDRDQEYYDHSRFAHSRSFPTQDTDVVARAKQQHHYLYRQIAADHAAIGAERAAGLSESDRYRQRPAYQTYY